MSILLNMLVYFASLTGGNLPSCNEGGYAKTVTGTTIIAPGQSAILSSGFFLCDMSGRDFVLNAQVNVHSGGEDFEIFSSASVVLPSCSFGASYGTASQRLQNASGWQSSGNSALFSPTISGNCSGQNWVHYLTVTNYGANDLVLSGRKYVFLELL